METPQPQDLLPPVLVRSSSLSSCSEATNGSTQDSSSCTEDPTTKHAALQTTVPSLCVSRSSSLWCSAKSFVQHEAPVVFGFVGICTILHVISVLWFPQLPRLLAIEKTTSTSTSTTTINTTTFTSISEMLWKFCVNGWFSHVLVHAHGAHWKGNMLSMLLVGPSVEQALGSDKLLFVIAGVALSTALVHVAFGAAYTYQLGASAVVCCLVLIRAVLVPVTLLNHSQVQATTNNTDDDPTSFLSDLASSFYMGLPLLLAATTWYISREQQQEEAEQAEDIAHYAHMAGGWMGVLVGYHHWYDQQKTQHQGTSNVKQQQ